MDYEEEEAANLKGINFIDGQNSTQPIQHILELKSEANEFPKSNFIDLADL
jgi:hypothetical protein